MQMTTLGGTGILVSRTAVGCLPMQRVSMEEAAGLLHRAMDAGVTFFDTARAYSDSEAKIGFALSGLRNQVTIATKTGARTADQFFDHLEESLRTLRLDAIDIYQFHNPPFVPKPGGEDGLYDAMEKAKAKGMVRHIGITQHSLSLAREAVESGLYETVQYPFNHLATDAEVRLVEACGQRNVGFICMKALSGGLITDASIAFAYLRQYPQAVPIWGVQRMHELEQIIGLEENPPPLDEAMQARIQSDRAALSGAFCRGCGYCMPCPAGIPINNANRMRELLARSPITHWVSEAWRADMERIEQCTRCGKCAKTCPYDLKPYETLPAQLAFYRDFVKTL